MELRTIERASASARGRDPDTIAAFQAGVKAYATYGAPLYAALCGRCADDPEIVALASHGTKSARPVHLFSAAHYLLLGGLDDPLAHYFATLTPEPLPPEEAFPAFAQFVRAHHDELLHLLETRTVQTTYAERCRALMPAMARAAEIAGAPLNLIEIGCSAGVLLTFDKYAYRTQRGEVVGASDAPLTLDMEVSGTPPLRIPAIGTRIGIDLRTIDVRREEERRWLLALCFPELRAQQQRLATALEVVAATDIRMMEGDALALLPQALAATPDPVCVFHSACLYYWDLASKAALDRLLREASATRDIVRVSIEPPEEFEPGTWDRDYVKRSPEQARRATGEIKVALYRRGEADRRVVAHSNSDYGLVEWIG